MRKLLATAAFLLASTAAQAQYTFEYGGRTIRIDPDRGTVQIPGVYDNTGQGKAKKAKKNETTRASRRRNRPRLIRNRRPLRRQLLPLSQRRPQPNRRRPRSAAANSAPARSTAVCNRQQRAG